MCSIDESVAKAMDCETTDIIKYLPYILQDFYEIGSLSKSILKVVKDQNYKDHVHILDLGCGKGAVLCLIAENVNSTCLGIVAVSEFIDYANEEVRKLKLNNCTFLKGDIRNKELLNGLYDIIILGSIGPVYGNYKDTMEFLKPILKPDGIIILDDGYTKDMKQHSMSVNKDVLLMEIESSGMEVIKEYLDEDICDKIDFNKQLNNIRKRCHELIIKYPEKEQIFRNYIKKQEKEYHSLEDDIICSTMVIKMV